MIEILSETITTPNDKGFYQKITKFRENGFLKKKTETYCKYVYKNRVSKQAITRELNWKPFGKALEENDKLCTFRGDEINIEYVKQHKKTISNIDDNKPFNICNIGIEQDKLNLKPKIKKTAKKQVYKLDVKNRKYQPPKTDTETQNQQSSSTPSLQTNKYVFKSSKKEDDGLSKTKLFLKNFNEEWMEDDIAELIEPFGDIKDIYILRDKKTGRSKSLAIITLYKQKVAQSIIDNFHNKPMGSLIVKIEWAKEKKKQ